MRDADQRYADVYTAATAAGWTPADLTALGYPPGTSAASRSRRTSRPATPTQRLEQDVPAPQPHPAPAVADHTKDAPVER